MAAVYVNNLVINAGCDFSQTFNLEAIETNSAFSLVGYTVSAQMRKWAGSSTSINFTTYTNPLAPSTIVLKLTADQTKNLKPGRYVYDVLITDPSSLKNRVIEGMVLLREGVTR
jgi:hypothetical protein